MPGSSSNDAGHERSGIFFTGERGASGIRNRAGRNTFSGRNRARTRRLFDPPDNKAQTASTGELIPKFIGDLPGLKRELPESRPRTIRGAARASRAEEPDGSTDDFVIELSENDLESLLKELNAPQRAKPNKISAHAGTKN